MDNDYNIALSPLFFVRGGNVNTGAQQLRYAGEDARYWSSRSYSDADVAYSLYFDGYSVYPSYNWDRYFGFSLRCLIPTT